MAKYELGNALFNKMGNSKSKLFSNFPFSVCLQVNLCKMLYLPALLSPITTSLYHAPKIRKESRQNLSPLLHASLSKSHTNKNIIISFSELQFIVFLVQIKIQIRVTSKRSPPPVPTTLLGHSFDTHSPLLTIPLQPFISRDKPFIIIIRNVHKRWSTLLTECSILLTKCVTTLNLLLDLVIPQRHTRFARVVLPKLLSLHHCFAHHRRRYHRHALERLSANLTPQRAILILLLVLKEVPAVGAHTPKRHSCREWVLPVVERSAFRTGQHVPGLLHTCERLVGEGKLVRARRVQEKR